MREGRERRERRRGGRGKGEGRERGERGEGEGNRRERRGEDSVLILSPPVERSSLIHSLMLTHLVNSDQTGAVTCLCLK